MRRRTRPKSAPQTGARSGERSLRIIGGRHRGRSLRTTEDPRTRPMKDRVREAVFNLLGTAVKGKQVLDLFAGSGALGLEALSRGAARAILIERHFPTARLVEQNVAELGLESSATVVGSDAFYWWRTQSLARDRPWLVFCSPPYDFFVSRRGDMLELIRAIVHEAPAESIVVIESDRRFDLRQLPASPAWDVRHYPPAVIALAELPLEETPRGREES